MMATVEEETDVLLHVQSRQGTYELELELDLEYSTEAMERNTQAKGEMTETSVAEMVEAILV